MNVLVRNSQRAVSSASHDPFKPLLERLFDSSFFSPVAPNATSTGTPQWTPPVDIKEEATQFVILADLPGVNPEDIEVQMDKGILSIKGERRIEEKNEAPSETFSRVERRHGSFHRRFALPDSANPEGISASGQNGVLTVVIPKRAETAPRRIPVGAAQSA